MNALSSKLPAVVRTGLGLVFVVFGLNGLLHFLPMPPLPADAAAFLGGLSTGGWFFPFLKLTEIAAGALLVANLFPALALTVLAPIVVNIVAYHAFLAPAGMALPIALVAAELYLAWAYRAAFAPMLRRRIEPARGADPARAGEGAARATA